MRYHNITKDDMLNGDGLRVVLWVAGCSHCCKGCHNPVTWDPDGGLLFDEKAKEEIFAQLDKSYISGLTFSGGDPLHESNVDDVYNLVNEIRILFPKKSIWLYTGYNVVSVDSEYKKIIFDRHEDIIDWLSFKTIIKHNKRNDIGSMCDVIVDGQYINSQRDITLPYRGSKNQKLINVKESIKEGEIVLWELINL